MDNDYHWTPNGSCTPRQEVTAPAVGSKKCQHVVSETIKRLDATTEPQRAEIRRMEWEIGLRARQLLWMVGWRFDARRMQFVHSDGHVVTVDAVETAPADGSYAFFQMYYKVFPEDNKPPR